MGDESLICYPSAIIHRSIPEELRNLIWITKDLIRMSVGIEDLKI
ncbi:MAG: PLP-dependent transferase [Bacteroidales bacterium]|nr:PLP-dependent transferase [Bacteroidales bacterium]